MDSSAGRAGAPGADILIDVQRLRVCFEGRCALEDLSFQVRAGELVGLLGPNGAGKTTTLSVLATLLQPTAGVARVAGHATDTEPRTVRRLLGLVPQSLAIYPTLTARENVRFFCQVLGLRGAAAADAGEEALALVGLAERGNDIVSTFSGGMQRRLNLACGLLHRPRVLLLDEPTVGVDPQSRERIFSAVRAQATAGAAILYSTHYMEEAERLCDRVVLIDNGRAIAVGTPAALVQAIGAGLRLIVITRSALPSNWLRDLDGVAGSEPAANGNCTLQRGNCVQVTIDELTTAPRVLERAAALGGEVLEFRVHQPDLQDVFIRMTGRELRD